MELLQTSKVNINNQSVGRSVRGKFGVCSVVNLGQSTIIIYESRVVLTLKLLILRLQSRNL